MTVRESVLKELSTGPKTLSHLERRCAMPGRDVMAIVAWMVAEGEVEVVEWVVDRGRFVPIYRRRMTMEEMTR